MSTGTGVSREIQSPLAALFTGEFDPRGVRRTLSCSASAFRLRRSGLRSARQRHQPETPTKSLIASGSSFGGTLGTDFEARIEPRRGPDDRDRASLRKSDLHRCGTKVWQDLQADCSYGNAISSGSAKAACPSACRRKDRATRKIEREKAQSHRWLNGRLSQPRRIAKLKGTARPLCLRNMAEEPLETTQNGSTPGLPQCYHDRSHILSALECQAVEEVTIRTQHHRPQFPRFF